MIFDWTELNLPTQFGSTLSHVWLVVQINSRLETAVSGKTNDGSHIYLAECSDLWTRRPCNGAEGAKQPNTEMEMLLVRKREPHINKRVKCMCTQHTHTMYVLLKLLEKRTHFKRTNVSFSQISACAYEHKKHVFVSFVYSGMRDTDG